MQFFTTSEVAERLSVSTATVHRWVSNGKLPSSRAGRLVRISETDLQAFYDRNRRGR